MTDTAELNELASLRPRTIFGNKETGQIYAEVIHPTAEPQLITARDGRRYLSNGKGQLLNPSKVRGKAEVKRYKRERMKTLKSK